MKRTPLTRRTPLRAKGESRYPKRRDPDYWRWLAEYPEPCEVHGTWPVQRAHLEKRGSGGYDRDNIVFLCPECHVEQEGRTDAFIAETGVDLYAKARAHTERYDRERGREEFPDD